MALREIVVGRWSGKSLRQIDLTNRFKVQVIAVKKVADNAFRYIPRADDTLCAGDRLVVLGRSEQLAGLAC